MGLVSREICGGCAHYYGTPSSGTEHCDFIGDTGKRRPCPAGGECTEYITAEAWAKTGKHIKVAFNDY